MFSLPSSEEASIVNGEESFAVPRVMGSFPFVLASLNSVGIGSFFIVDCERDGSQELLGLRLHLQLSPGFCNEQTSVLDVGYVRRDFEGIEVLSLNQFSAVGQTA